jgi:exodeoxyribonuclease VII large subunit
VHEFVEQAARKENTPMTAIKSYSVSKYLTAIKNVLTARVPGTWVNGTITQLQAKGAVYYITLAEIPPESLRPSAAIPLVLYKGDWAHIQQKLAPIGGLQADSKVSFFIHADLYVPFGKLQGRIADVDPAFTLGEMALQRQRVLELLTKEGLLRKNALVPFPELPLKIGLITSLNSAAYHDFMEIITLSGFAVDVITADARMQGQETEKSVSAAFEQLIAQQVSVICLVRGGGSKADLAWFDSELLCRIVANCPCPVLTGIGHEIDQSLVDEVAYSNRITPTACAKYIVDHLQTILDKLVHLREQLATGVRNRVKHEEFVLHSVTQRIQKNTPGRYSQELSRYEYLLNGFRKGPYKILQIHKAGFMEKQAQIASSWGARKSREHSKLDKITWTLQSAAKAKLQKQKDSLPFLEKLIHKSDPVRVLQKGYAVARTANGTIVKDIKQLQPGARLDVQLQEGLIQTQITGLQL